jgi:hypothetical protein
MTAQAPVRQRSIAMRRTGYAIAVVVNVAFWFAINRWPGWEAVPFLTADTVLVLGWVNVSIATGIAANVAYLAYDEPWFRAVGDVVTTAVGLGALIRIWRVFPIDAAAPWPMLARFLLVVAIGGSVIGLIVQATSLVRALKQRSAT